MHVVHYCPTPYPVPPTGYGGTERLVYWLARVQRRQGLRVSIVAHPASRLEALLPGARLVPWDPVQPLDALLPRDADIVHLHKLPEDRAEPQRPYLITEHGIRGPDTTLLPNTVFVSRAHAALHGRSTFVPNGVPVEDYRYSDEKDRYLLFLSRMEWPHKNARTAIDLAVDLRLKLVMSGKYSPWVRPKLWGDWCRHPLAVRRYVERIGYVDGERKLGLLARAPVLFHAVNWHEPAGLIVLEALASGTPVLAAPNGALPELVADGETGRVVRSYDEARDAVVRLLALEPAARRRWAQACRAAATPIEATARGYAQLYERVRAGERLVRDDENRPAAPRPLTVVRKPG